MPPLTVARPMPERLGRYAVRAKIGEGGMATVYLGHDTSPGADRVVALKVIKDEFSLNPDFVNMFLDESKIVARLNHPNVVHVYELGSEGTRLFMALELLFGQSLWHVWNACRTRGLRLRYDVAAWIGARAAEGLHHAHELRGADGAPLNVVHRDVNASNIFITYDGHVKIIDFGLAKAIGRVSKTAAGVVKGKLAYMSPEQAVGKPLDRRSDIFALGTTLWEITVDHRLFKGADDLETLKKVYAADVTNPTQLIEGYPPALAKPILRALARDPRSRHATAAAFAKDLDAFASVQEGAVGPEIVAEIMSALFRGERERQANWVNDASRPDRPAPRDALVDERAPRLGQPIPEPPPSASQKELESGLFSGPAVTVRDPVLAARQEATAQGGFTAGEIERIKRTAEAPFGQVTGEMAKIPMPRAATPGVSEPSVPRAGVAMAAFFGVLTLLVVAAVLAGVVWMMRR